MTHRASAFLSLGKKGLLVDDLGSCLVDLHQFLVDLVHCWNCEAVQVDLRLGVCVARLEDRRHRNQHPLAVPALVLEGLRQDEVPHDALELLHEVGIFLVWKFELGFGVKSMRNSLSALQFSTLDGLLLWLVLPEPLPSLQTPPRLKASGALWFSQTEPLLGFLFQHRC